MHFNTLETFRQQVYSCFERQQDALVSEPAVRSLAELSPSPFFVRRWLGLYAGLALDGGASARPRAGRTLELARGVCL